jgi:hypothetical protein
MMVRICDLPDISCEHGKHAVESELATVPGVTTTIVAIEAKTVHVEGHAAEAPVGSWNSCAVMGLWDGLRCSVLVQGFRWWRG